MTLRHAAYACPVLLSLLAVDAGPGARAADTIPAAVETKADLQPARDKIKAGDFQGAMPLLAAVVKDNPRNADALNLMGFSLRKTGRWNEALDYYNKALAIEPKHLGANEYLGELYAERGDVAKAKERLAVLEAACGKDCEQTKDLAQAIGKAPAK